MKKATVKWFSNRLGYGFLELENGEGDVFVHYSGILAEGFKSLNGGQLVTFDVEDDERGAKAVNVSVVWEPGEEQ